MNQLDVIVMVIWHDFRLTLFFISLSPTLHTLVDLIFLLILSIHMTLILSYPSLHIHYLTFFIFPSNALVYSMTSNRTREQLSHWGQRGCYPGGKLGVY